MLLLFAVFIVLFFVVRHFLISEPFGKYRFYRANPIREISANPTKFSGKTVSIEYHDTEAAQLASDAHNGLSYEVYHGTGENYAGDFDSKFERPGTREFCGTYRNLNPARRIEIINQIERKLTIRKEKILSIAIISI